MGYPYRPAAPTATASVQNRVNFPQDKGYGRTRRGAARAGRNWRKRR